jgi:preprotein translocase subunit SecA
MDDLKALVLKQYEEKEQRLTAEGLRHLERNIMLYVIDSRWKDHLLGMDDMKDGIYLRGYGQKDPLVEYKHEAFRVFEEMMIGLSEEATEFVFRSEATIERKEEKRRVDFIHDDVSAFSQEAIATNAPEGPKKKMPVKTEKVAGRNEPCPCGSGKKYKKCCGKEG